MTKILKIFITFMLAIFIGIVNVFAYEVGDIIEFGSYPYEADGTEKPIEWQILEKYADGTALVISKYALDNVKYNEKDTRVTWKTSSIRKWLNNDFYNKAFRNADKSLIIESYVVNKDNAESGTKGGNNTYDKMFLLSIDEANKYFGSAKERMLYPTLYAKGSKSKEGKLWTDADYGGSCWWWLRSPGTNHYNAAGVGPGGDVYSYGNYVSDDNVAVRVVFKINLKNLKSFQAYGGSPAAMKSGGKTQGMSAAGSKFSKPPRLSVANISFNDDSNAKVLMADGKGNISFTVINSQAGGTAYSLKALISAKDLSGKALQNVSFPAAKEIGNISPGKSVKVDIPITGGDNLASGTAAFTISFAEANGFEPEAKTIQIQTVKLDPPDIQLAEFGLDDTEGELSFGNGNGIVEPGESIVLNLALLNDGNGATKGTKITFESGDQNIFFIDNTQFSKGNIQPGAKTNIKTAFSINRRYKGNEVLPITMKITDERKRFSKTIPLNIALKRSYPKTEVITVAGNYKKPQKIKAQADGIKNIPDAKTQNRYGVAVIIGVRNYENKVPPVLFALNDAQTMRDYAVKALGYSPDNIIYVQDPTKGQMEEIFGTDKTHKGKLFNYLKPGKSDVFIYYAGHGAPDQDTRAAYFVPKDANPDYIKIGGYAMETLCIQTLPSCQPEK